MLLEAEARPRCVDHSGGSVESLELSGNCFACLAGVGDGDAGEVIAKFVVAGELRVVKGLGGFNLRTDQHIGERL